MVICVSWDQSLINYPLSFSAMTLLVGSLTRKIVSEMTYIVSSGTLNPTILYYTMLSRPLPTSAVLLPPPWSVLYSHNLLSTGAVPSIRAGRAAQKSWSFIFELELLKIFKNKFLC